MIQTILSKIEQTSSKQLYLIFGVLAALIAAQMQYIQHGWINPDSVLYFESARLIALGDFKAAFAVFNWPLYSICIVTVHKLTTLSIHQSAQVLNVVFFTITALSFTKLISLAGGNKITMAAGALILFSSSYIVGDVLEMLMRDEGFWAFYLSSLVFFIQFYKQQRYQDAFLWQIFAILATLFRIEAIMYLVFIPFVLLLNTAYSWPQRFKHLIKVNFLNIIAALGIIATLAFSKHMTMANFGRLKEVFSANLWHELTQNLIMRADIMADEVLGNYLDEFAIEGLLLTFMFVIIIKIFSAVGVINVVLATLTVKHRHITLEPSARIVLTATGFISLIIMSLIIIKVFVLSTRYVVGFGFILMILASFYLAFLLNQIRQTPRKKSLKKWLVYVLLLFMVLSVVKNMLPKRDGYNYLQEAAAWIIENNSENSSVFYDDQRVQYYADAPFKHLGGDGWDLLSKQIATGQILDYQILALSVTKKHSERTEYLEKNLTQYQLVNVFKDHSGKKAINIYTLKK